MCRPSLDRVVGMKIENRSFGFFLAIGFLLASAACSDNSTCVSCDDDSVDPSKLIDPRSLGDGSG